MPRATAVWLVEKTSLTFEQIGSFCSLHPAEVQALADGDVNARMRGVDPVVTRQLTAAEIQRCEQDPQARLQLSSADEDLPQPLLRSKGKRYTPLAKRQDRPSAIAWCLRNHPELSDAQLVRLIQTTKTTVQKIREKKHWNQNNLKPRSPADIGMCSYEDLHAELVKAQKRQDKARERSLGETESSVASVSGDALPPGENPLAGGAGTQEHEDAVLDSLFHKSSNR